MSNCLLLHSEPVRMKKKKSVPMSELSEEAQRLKRAAWRAASRRYYARKIARQQAGSAHAAHVFSQVRGFRCSGLQRRTLVEELPDDCPLLHRDAPTFCTPKVTHGQMEPRECVRLGLDQDPEWPEEPLEANGILCS